MKTHITSFVKIFLIFMLLSCKSKVEFSNSEQLEKYIKLKSNLNIKNAHNNTLIIILQNEDCICTDKDMALSKRLLESNRYSNYEKILILNSKKHKIFKLISFKNINKMKIIYDSSNEMMKHNYIATTDRVIVYDEGKPNYFADLHHSKPEIVEKDLLN